MKKYINRIVDQEIDKKLSIFGALQIIGPKWCGKTTTGEHHSKSEIKFQETFDVENLIKLTRFNPGVLLEGDKPRLIDEWQDAPNIYDAVRNYCDNSSNFGNFILTGSTSRKVTTRHTGTGRISKILMYPMSLYESGESNGHVSLIDLFNDKKIDPKRFTSSLSLEDLIFLACRGGWPKSLLIANKTDQLEVAKDYYKQIYTSDMYNVDQIKRNAKTMRAILRSYARNISTLASLETILADVASTNKISKVTLYDYIDVLDRLYIVKNLEGWCPMIRSATAMRSGKKIEFVDPSIAVAALKATPKSLLYDLKTFGFIFETLCIRDLRVYSSKFGGEICYYHDRYDLEVDAVLFLNDGRYALIEIKLGDDEIDEGIRHLNKVEQLIKTYNKKETKKKLDLPTLKMVVTGSKYGYKTKDNVFVIPIGCLKD
ncbi:MAG: DUF4143 domain-containing protein [Bacilli bacterium]|nr:DUF4143 domain-containing protein [Bacilli bacterium]